MPADILIRPAEAADARAIAAIHAASWQQAYRGMMPDAFLDSLTPESRLPMWEQVLSGSGTTTRAWVAVVDGEIAGFTSFGPLDTDPTIADFQTLYLDPSRMGQGTGRLLLARAETEMVAAGYRTARLLVLRDNLRARHVYESAGWTSDGIDIADDWLDTPIVERAYTKPLGTPPLARDPGPPVDSAAWYDGHAQEYADRTDNVDLADHYDRFLALVPPGGRLLDAGCGPGRDSLAFLARGYDVTAMDASIGMVQLASLRLGQPVLHLRHEEIAFDHEFDGIWANATLLHVPHASLPDVLARYRTALVPDGVMFASFKLGAGEVIGGDRLFANQDAGSFREVLATVPGLALIEIWTTFDRRPGREQEQWLNALIQRQGNNVP